MPGEGRGGEAARYWPSKVEVQRKVKGKLLGTKAGVCVCVCVCVGLNWEVGCAYLLSQQLCVCARARTRAHTRAHTHTHYTYHITPTTLLGKEKWGQNVADTWHTFDVTGFLTRVLALTSQEIDSYPYPLHPPPTFYKSTTTTMKASGTAFKKWFLIKITPQTGLWGLRGLHVALCLFCRQLSGVRLPLAKMEGRPPARGKTCRVLGHLL